REAVKEDFDGGFGDDLGQFGGGERAAVLAVAEGHVGAVGRGVALLDLGVGVGGGEAEHDHVAAVDAVAGEFAVLGGEAGGDALDGRVLPEDVVERFADAAPAALEVHLEVVVDEHQAEGVADPVGGAAVGGDHQGDHVPDGVLVGVGGGVGQQAGGEVVAGAGAFAGDEPDHRLGGAAFGGDGLLAAVHDEEDVGDEGGGVRLR